MDDYSMNSLSDSKNEWCARLVNILTPVTIQGIKSIFEEAHNLCRENDELDKYLMTFQTFLSRVPKWNNTIIETERKRIVEASGCTYLEELITCVHVIQLKSLTCVRVGQKQKKVDIDVPSVDDFIHKVYSNVARKLYTNIYLFEKNIAPLQIQKHNRELELIIKECIMNSVRESIPVETILRAYMDETDENDVEVSEVEEQIPIVEETEPEPPVPVQVKEQYTEAPAVKETNEVDKSQTRLSFSNVDKAVDVKGVETMVDAPKTIERLETLALLKASSDDEDDDERIKIGGNISLDISDINDLNRPLNILPPPILDDIEILS
uniref:Uncharacterized protein n=1 Tax=viral metagenome TaxID=1070528 RepID=A0A6C0IJK3_9ZZZZ